MGFQIWINVPSERKMDDPRYGTEPPENIPVFSGEGVSARVLAGTLGDLQGPFSTVQSVQIVDYTLEPGANHIHSLHSTHDNCLIYAYKGSGAISGVNLPAFHVARLNAEELTIRDFSLTADSDGLSVMVFAGKRLNQPIAWHGPFVMTTDAEIDTAVREYQRGTFLKKRAPWDYKRMSAFPKNHDGQVS